jgi:ketosteroid isomerase-like protein
MTASENLDLVHSIFADWERGDFGSADWADPDIEFVIADGLTPGEWRGVVEMAQGWREHLEAFEGHSVHAHGLRELDGGRVLVRVTVSARGKRSGTEAHASGANVFYVSAGKVTRLVIYWDRDRALADLGLKA